MTDIVERLRAGFQCDEIGNRCRTMDAKSGCVCAEAADEIERLRAALREYVCDCPDDSMCKLYPCGNTARAALERN